jgi:hypothetical protein
MGVCHEATVHLLFLFGNFTFRHPFSLTGSLGVNFTVLNFLHCKQDLKLETQNVL